MRFWKMCYHITHVNISVNVFHEWSLITELLLLLILWVVFCIKYEEYGYTLRKSKKQWMLKDNYEKILALY